MLERLQKQALADVHQLQLRLKLCSSFRSHIRQLDANMNGDDGRSVYSTAL